LFKIKKLASKQTAETYCICYFLKHSLKCSKSTTRILDFIITTDFKYSFCIFLIWKKKWPTSGQKSLLWTKKVFFHTSEEEHGGKQKDKLPCIAQGTSQSLRRHSRDNFELKSSDK